MDQNLMVILEKSNINQNIFIQTQLKVYNNYKEYPLYPILAKKRLNFSKIICSNQKSKRSKIKKNSTKLKELILEEIKEESEIDTVDDGEKSWDLNINLNSIWAENSDKQTNADERQSELSTQEYQSNLFAELKNETSLWSKPVDQVLQDYQLLTADQKQQLPCDEVWGLYLRDVSLKVSQKFYRTVLKFMILFREWCNEYCWLKVAESLKLLQNQRININVPIEISSTTTKTDLLQQQMVIMAEMEDINAHWGLL